MGWTDERVELLKKLWAEGLSASQIAGRLGGVTRNAVIGKVHRLGLSGRATSSRSSSPRPRRTHVPRANRAPSLDLLMFQRESGISMVGGPVGIPAGQQQRGLAAVARD